MTTHAGVDAQSIRLWEVVEKARYTWKLYCDLVTQKDPNIKA